jgi:NAD+ kinase
MDEPSPASGRQDQHGQPKKPLRQLGLVIHPTRRVEGVLEEIGALASNHGLAVGQVEVPGQIRRVAEPVTAGACDLLLAVGGDGTALVALHVGAPTPLPVLGIAAGSIGALTTVSAKRVTWALDQIAAGRWTPLAIPGLDVGWGEEATEVAINDVAVVRDGPGQVVVSISVDDVLYARIAADGLVVATALGSSAYNMAAGGPLLAPGAVGMVATPLEPHGGSCPPLVAGAASHLTLEIEPGFGGVRYELDGRRAGITGSSLTVHHHPDYATLVRLAEEEPRLTGLRRRNLVIDSPRVLVREHRLSEHGREAGP